VKNREILDSWKEIAAYLGRSEKTCRRLEKELGLPVHRLEESPKARVYAYKDEVDAWRQRTQHSEEMMSSIKETPGIFARKKTIFLGFIILGLAAIAFFVFRKSEPELDPNRIVVAVFENQTGDPSHDTIGRMAADWITQGLVQTGLVDIVPIMSIEHKISSYEGEDLIRFLVKDTKAGTIISGAYYLQGDKIQIHVKITDAREGKLLTAIDPVSGSLHSLAKLLEELRQQLMVKLAANLDPVFGHFADIVYLPPSYEAYKEYREGMKYFYLAEYDQAIEHYLEASSLDPAFDMSKLWAAAAYFNIGEYAKDEALLREVDSSRDRLGPVESIFLDALTADIRGDHLGSYRAYSKMAKLFPLPPHIYVVGLDALFINRPREAADLISSVDPEVYYKNWWRYWTNLTYAHHRLGNHKQELKEARRGRKQYPDLLSTLHLEIRALAALGRIKEVNDRLAESLSLPPQPGWNPGKVMRNAGRILRSHGYREESVDVLLRAEKWFESRSTKEAENESFRCEFGEMYYFLEKWEDSQKIFESLHSEFPDNIGYLGRLGTLAARRGRIEEALKIAEQLEKMDRPYLFGQHLFWRGLISALLGEKEIAMKLLKDAISQGANYHELFANMDIEPLTDYPPFQEFFRPK